MEKKILEELYKIKSLMGYDRSNPNGLLIREQVEADPGIETPNIGAFGSIVKSDGRKCRDPKTGINWNPFDSDEDEIRWPETNLGPKYNSPYPITWPKADMVGIPVICSRETGEAVVWQFKGTETAKNFVPNVQVGDIKDVNGILHKDQEYILEKKDNKDIKRCLPVKEWWEIYTKYKIIYKFQNPSTGNIYGMRLVLDPDDFEASEKCLGGNNGWGFLDFGYYFLKGGDGRAYDPKKPEDFDIRSNDDKFWDKYGMYIEIGVGIALAFAIPYIGPFIIAGLGLTGTAFATTTYFGGISIGMVIIESLAELVILSPLIINQLERNNTGTAILTILFCGLPFVTEIPAMSKFLKKGLGAFIRTDADDLIKTIEGLGDDQFLTRVVELYKQNGIDVTKRYVEQVIPNAKQRDILYAGLEIITESGKDLNKVIGATLEHLVKENQEAVAKKISQRGLSEGDKAAQDLGNFLMAPFKGPLTGTGVIPSLARGVLIFGSFAVLWDKGYKAVEKYFKDEKEFEYTEKMAKDAMDKSEFWNDLKKVSFGFKQEIDIVNVIESIAANDPNFKDKEAEVKAKLVVEYTERQTKEVIKKNDEKISKSLAKFSNNETKNVALLSKHQIIEKMRFMKEIIKEIIIKNNLNYNGDNINFPKIYENFDMNWDFTIQDNQQKSYNGYIKFIGGEEGTYEIFIDNKKIFPDK
jgi:hypothetical protein